MNLTCHISPVSHLNGTTTWTANWTLQETPHPAAIIITGFVTPELAQVTMQELTKIFANPPDAYVIHHS